MIRNQQRIVAIRKPFHLVKAGDQSELDARVNPMLHRLKAALAAQTEAGVHVSDNDRTFATVPEKGKAVYNVACRVEQ